jgi:SAM-dependent methyltransferase
MHYDPIKNKLGKFFNLSPQLRVLFYKLLDLLLLRTWHIHKELRAWIAKQHNNKVSILDAGMGFGQYSYWMANKIPNCQINAVDVKEDQIQDCTQFFKKVGVKNINFEVQDLVVYQNPDSYDLILSVDVMEHILEDVEVFKNFYASLKPGGMLLINTPSDQGGSDADDHSDESFIGEHVRNGYNINEIQDKLKLAGFSKIEAKYAYGKPGSLAWKLSMKYPMLMLNASFIFIIILPFYYILTFPFALLLNSLDVKQSHPKGTGLVVKAWK